MEQEVKETACNVANAICDAMRFLGDVSYAILPREVAHDIGDLNKSFWTCIRNAVDKEIEWIGERVEGGDKMREEWEQRRHEGTAETSEPVS